MTVQDLVMRGCDKDKFVIVKSPGFLHTVILSSNNKIVNKMLYVTDLNFGATLRKKINNSNKVYIYETNCPWAARLSFPEDDFEIDSDFTEFEKYYDNY